MAKKYQKGTKGITKVFCPKMFADVVLYPSQARAMQDAKPWQTTAYCTSCGDHKGGYHLVSKPRPSWKYCIAQQRDIMFYPSVELARNDALPGQDVVHCSSCEGFHLTKLRSNELWKEYADTHRNRNRR